MSAGSRRARTTPTFCSSASSSAGSCALPTGARPGTTIVPERSRTSTRSPGIRATAERAYEAGGGGSAWSEDGGDTWHAADEGRDRHYTWSVAVDPDDPELWYVTASTGPYAAHGGRDPQALIYRRRNGDWTALAGGLPDPIPAMPYALVAFEGGLVAGLADGQLWGSRDQGENWERYELEGDALTELHALVRAG